MPEALENDHFELEPFAGGSRGAELPRIDVTTDDERPLREELRRQIAHLEQQLSELWTSSFPRKDINWSVGAAGGPRILGAADLERVRDALIVRIREAQTELGRRADVEERNRGLVERMIAQPERYRWVQISNEDVGDRDCKHWHSRPRFGLVGMLMGWWRVKLSSGCPLAGGELPRRQRHTEITTGTCRFRGQAPQGTPSGKEKEEKTSQAT